MSAIDSASLLSSNAHTSYRLRAPRRAPALIALLLSITAASAFANELSFAWKSDAPQVIAGVVGSGDATFQRAQSCAGLSGAATSVYYDTYVISNPTGSPAMLDVRTQPPGGDGTMTCAQNVNDSVMAIYTGTFSPANALQGCAAFNDDAAGLDRCSRISDFTIPANSSVTLVVTTSANGNQFPYDLRFEGSRHLGPIFRDGGGESSQAAVPRALPVGAAFTLDNYPVSPQPGSRFNGEVNFMSQNISGPLALLPMTASGILTNAGPATLRMQFWHAGNTAGTVVGSNATLNASDLYLRLQTASINGTPLNLGGDCKFGPLSWATTGTWNGSTIVTSAASFGIPAAPSSSCAGLGSQLNTILVGTENSVMLTIIP